MVLTMGMMGMIGAVIDEAVGNRGAVENCRHEMVRREQDIAAVDRLCRQLRQPRGLSRSGTDASPVASERGVAAVDRTP